jgi:uncharacterized protein involved in copper resistance
MQGFRRAAVCLAILAMVLRGLVPAGWMPNPEGMSKTALIICDMDETGMSKMDMSHMSGMDMPDKDQAPTHKQADDGHSQACPFAAAPHFAAVPTIVALVVQSFQFTRTEAADNFAQIASGRRHSSQSPRAPPSLA